MAGTRSHTGSHLYSLVTRATDLKIDFVLPFEQNFAVVNPARCVHQPERPNQSLRIKTRCARHAKPFGSSGRAERRRHR